MLIGMVKLITLNKPIFMIFILLSTSLGYSNSQKSFNFFEECNIAKEYKSFTIGKTENEIIRIENELFGNSNFSYTLDISRSDGGIHYKYYFYKVEDENLCLGIKAYNNLQEDAVIYLNTQQQCGSKCKIYLNESKDNQIFYVWEPLKEIIKDKHKEKIVIKTNKQTYIVLVRTGTKELELFVDGFQKIKTIKGLDKFPNLTNLSLIGFEY